MGDSQAVVPAVVELNAIAKQGDQQKTGIQQAGKLAQKSLSVRLKAGTTSTHDSLDLRIMRADPFSSQDRYKHFLKVQYVFHWVTEPLYFNEKIANWIPHIHKGCRVAQVKQDCLDLGMSEQEIEALVAPFDKVVVSDTAALGWLYTLEGSNIGAAFLFKFAKKIGLDEHFGASHLAGNPEGRGRYWNKFKNAVDALSLTPEQEQDVQQGAANAFALVRSLVEKHLP